MYLGYFGLTERPFSIAPDPQYLYMSKRHKEATAHLSYGLSQGGCFIVLTGEVGTGKTTLCRNLLGDLPESIDVALILNANINEQELLQTVCDELKIGYQSDSSQKQLLDRINQSLLATFAENRQTVLIIDEAQLLSRDVLEQIRLLTNLETTKSKLLQIILIGQPELNDLLSRNDLRQLAQRVTARYHLGPLQREEIEEYVNFRLSVAGCKQPLFSRQALTHMHSMTEGIPRKINVLADHALLSAYASTQRMVDSKTIKKAARDVFIHTRSEDQPSRFKLPGWWWAVPMLIVLNLGIWYWFSLSNSDDVVNNQVVESQGAAVLEKDVLSPLLDQGAPPADLPVFKSAESEEFTELATPELNDEQIRVAVTADAESATVTVNINDDVEPGSVSVSEEFLDTSPVLEVPSDSRVSTDLDIPTDLDISTDLDIATQVGTEQQGNALGAETVLSNTPAANFERPVAIPEPVLAIPSDAASSYSADTPFGKVLEASADLTGRIKVFKSLAEQWQATLPRKLLQPACTALIAQGLQCLVFDSWGRFERFNRPGIMVLKHRDQLHRVIVQSVSNNTARVLIGEQYHEVSLVELLARWTNKGVLFWRPTEIGSLYLEQGAKSTAVPKVRSRLNRALAAVDLPLLKSTTNIEFDLDMAQKVFALQARFGISQDSHIGSEVYLLMNEILAPKSTVVLSAERVPNRRDVNSDSTTNSLSTDAARQNSTGGQ